ncbi:MAG: hypothetical protein HOP18_08500 [Deltaproteobacteria bacterium]|nr:hypothetical protein [Deltaproteobacteria bacterium]
MAIPEQKTLATVEELTRGIAEDRTKAPQVLMGDVGGANTLDKVRDILFGGQAREFERHFARMEERLAKTVAELREDLKRGLDTLEAYAKKEVEAIHERLRAEATERGVAVKALGQDLQAASATATQQLRQLADQTEKQLRAEATERGAAVKALGQDIQTTRDAATQQVQQLEEQTSTQVRVEATTRGAAITALSQDLQAASATAMQKLQQVDEQTTKQFREVRAQLLEQARTQSEDLRQKYTELTTALEHAIQELRSNKTDRAGLAALFTEAAVRLQNEFRLPGNE